MARLLVIMGSGETSPTMSKVHRALLRRAGPGPAVVLDTPFGFQENADEIAAKAVAYFKESVQHDLVVASFRSAEGADAHEYETALARLREASYVFAGPGSPSYAVTQWAGSQVPAVLAQKLRTGGCVTFASAAACTLGPFALPVYEIYKVGAPVHWLDGLNLTGGIGLPAVVVPHFNNAEGGDHDTRFCYMGERRLSMLEATLPPEVFILGVDEHTACILDLDANTATVAGIGTVTVRRRGAISSFATGTTVTFAELTGASTTAASSTSETDDVVETTDPLVADIDRFEADFRAALATGAAQAAVTVALQLDDLLHDWSHDTTQSDLLDQGRAGLHAMLVRLGEAARSASAIHVWSSAPSSKRCSTPAAKPAPTSAGPTPTHYRDQLLAAGVEVHDTAGGVEWQLR